MIELRLELHYCYSGGRGCTGGFGGDGVSVCVWGGVRVNSGTAGYRLDAPLFMFPGEIAKDLCFIPVQSLSE